MRKPTAVRSRRATAVSAVPGTTGPGTTGRRLLAESGPARGYLIVTALLGLAVTVLILAQAGLLAHVLASAAAGRSAAALRASLVALLAVVVGRAAAVQAGEVAALRGAAKQGQPALVAFMTAGFPERAKFREQLRAIAAVADGIIFGLAHFELLELLGLAAFGALLALMAYKFRRLGPGIFAHGTFNLLAILSVAGILH